MFVCVVSVCVCGIRVYYVCVYVCAAYEYALGTRVHVYVGYKLTRIQCIHTIRAPEHVQLIFHSQHAASGASIIHAAQHTPLLDGYVVHFEVVQHLGTVVPSGHVYFT